MDVLTENFSGTLLFSARGSERRYRKTAQKEHREKDSTEKGDREKEIKKSNYRKKLRNFLTESLDQFQALMISLEVF